MIQLDDLSYSYTAKRPLLQKLFLGLPPQAVTVIVGPNGCGKSTLLKLCAGLLKPKAGSVLLEGRSLLSFPPRQRAKRIALLQQQYPPIHLPAGQVVLSGRNPYRRRGRGFGALDRELAKRAMAQTDCLHLQTFALSGLSGGERQRVFLAMALAQQSDIILLDEPTASLDIHASLALMEFLRHLQRSQGKTIVVVLHDLDLALRYAHHIVVMKSGTIVAAGTPQAIANNRALEQVFQVQLHTMEAQGQVFYGFTPMAATEQDHAANKSPRQNII